MIAKPGPDAIQAEQTPAPFKGPPPLAPPPLRRRGGKRQTIFSSAAANSGEGVKGRMAGRRKFTDISTQIKGEKNSDTRTN